MTTRIGSRQHVPVTAAEVGMARQDITPPIGIRSNSWPLSDWEQSSGIHRPMTLTALAVVPPEEKAQVILALDAGFWGRVDDEWGVRGRVLKALGLKPEQLIICLSHTHSGPLLTSTSASLPGGEHILAYYDLLVGAAVVAASEALSSRSPGRIQWTTGTSALAGNRELDLDGRAIVGFNPAETADDTVLVGRVTAADGLLVGTIVNYACHPTTLAWQNSLISPDYVGAMREVVETETGALCMFLQGASGELAPREQYTGDIEVADRHGRGLGHAVLAALETMPPAGTELELTGIAESGAPLGLWASTEGPVSADSTAFGGQVVPVEITLRELATLEELRERWADIDPRSIEERLTRARNQRDGYITGPTVMHPVWVWHWGEAFVVAQPGEAYSYLQTTLRKRFPDSPVIVVNLSNGPGFVYLPTEEAYERGAYQAWQTPFAPGCVDLVADAATEAIVALGGMRR